MLRSIREDREERSDASEHPGGQGGVVDRVPPHFPSSRARCNILHVAPQTRDLAIRSGAYVHPIPDQHRTTEVVLRSIRDDGVSVQ